MKFCTRINLQFAVFMTVALFVLYTAYEIDRHTVEEMFLKMHPDIDHLDSAEWKECDNLDVESLNRICFEVLSSLNITKKIVRVDRNYTYIPPSGKQPVQLERVIKHAPVKFHHVMKHTTYMTLIHCHYNETDIFLAQADDKHVFRLEKDPRDQKCYFKSGLHAVNFTLP